MRIITGVYEYKKFGLKYKELCDTYKIKSYLPDNIYEILNYEILNDNFNLYIDYTNRIISVPIPPRIHRWYIITTHEYSWPVGLNTLIYEYITYKGLIK